MTFSASDAAFEGFRVVRRHPAALAFWTLAYLIVFILMFLVAGPRLITLMSQAEAIQGAAPDAAQLELIGRSYLGLIGLLMPLGLVFGAVLNTAVARSVIRPQESSFGYMRLGGDELRVLAVSVILSLVLGLAIMVMFLSAGLLIGLARAVGGVGLGLLAGVIFILAAIGGAVWLALRFSLAVPITVAERRIAVFDSFRLTRGAYWSLLGMTLLCVVLSMVVGLLFWIVTVPITLATGGLTNLAQAAQGGLPQLLSAGAPAILAWCVINAISSALQLAVVYAPFAAAYQALAGARSSS